MARNTKLAQAIKLALLTGAATGGAGSMSAAFGQDAELEEITVTGSRIAKRDAISESPIFTVDQDTMQVSGYVTLDQYLNTLPQITPNVSSQSNNPSSGGRAFIDLRGLGVNRNLVLIDGRRAMGQVGGGTVVDTNTIPAALIERVEIISGGAAATYGADAIAGVVNFIMKKDFEGVNLDTQYRVTEEGDGEEITTDLTLGSAFADGRGNAVFNASYFDRKAMYKDAREFSAQASGPTGIFPNGSWATGTNRPDQTAVDGVFGPGNCADNGGSRGFGLNPDGSLFCTGLSNNPLDLFGYEGPAEHIATQFLPDFSYNFEPDNILVLPMERWSLYTHLDLEISEYFKPYVQAMFTNYNALQELAATPVGGLTIPVGNPFIPTELAGLLASRPGCNIVDPNDPNNCLLLNADVPFSFNKRFSALGGRTGYNTHDVWQLVGGTTGDLTESWSYDIYGSWGRSVRNEVQGGNVRLNRTEELLDSFIDTDGDGVDDTFDGGASICDGGLNLFGNAPISQACQDYVSLQAKNLTVAEQGVAEAIVNGDLFELPAGTVQAAFGASYRNVDFQFLPDSGLQPGLVAGFNEQLPVSGRLDYTDLFAEFSVPILSELPMMQNLSATLGFRNTDNNIFGNAESWKATFDWTMVDSVRFRGGFQHAIRSPNISELFAPQLNNFPDYEDQDPCNFNSTYRTTGPDPAAVTALCTGQAAVAGDPTYVQAFGQAQAIVGGNPDLEPEEADSWTAGFVLSPEFNSPWMQRTGLTIDYFSIKLEDVVDDIDAVTIITRCYNAEGANPTYSATNEWCSLFNRDQQDGRVIDLQQFQRNQSVWELSGVDVTMNWGADIGPGELDLAALASWLESFERQTTSVDPFNEYAGTIGAATGSAAPEWRGTLQGTYSMETLQFLLTARYISAMSHEVLVTTPGSTATGTGAVWYTDLAARYDVTDSISLRLGINNVFDEEPQLYAPNVQANTDPSTYDVLGRRYFFGLEWRM